MSQAVPLAGEGAAVTLLSHFEVHVQREGRWTIDCIARTAAEALAEAEEIARRPEVLGCKIVNERYNPLTDLCAARVVHRFEKPRRKRQPAARAPRPSSAAPSSALSSSAAMAPAWAVPPPSSAPPPAAEAAARPLSGIRPAAPPAPSLWLSAAWAGSALAVAATLLFALLSLAG